VPVIVPSSFSYISFYYSLGCALKKAPNRLMFLTALILWICLLFVYNNHNYLVIIVCACVIAKWWACFLLWVAWGKGGTQHCLTDEGIARQTTYQARTKGGRKASQEFVLAARFTGPMTTGLLHSHVATSLTYRSLLSTAMPDNA
jgi:hypothetical protein